MTKFLSDVGDSNVMPTLNISEVQSFIGRPVYSFADGHWVPPSHHKLFSSSDLVESFRHEQVLFVGDSWLCQAAATLSKLQKEEMPKTHDVKLQERRRRRTSSHGSPDKDKSATSSELSQDGNTHWYPEKLPLQNAFTDRSLKDYTILVFGLDDAEIINGPISPNQVRKWVKETLWSLLDKQLSSSTLIVWRSFGWCNSCEWEIIQSNEESRKNNYLVYVANQQAKETILEYQQVLQGNKTIIYMDWAREVLQYSFEEERIARETGEEFSMLLIQMLANEVYSNQTTILYDNTTEFPSETGKNETLSPFSTSRRLRTSDDLGSTYSKAKLVDTVRNIDTANATVDDTSDASIHTFNNDILTQMSFNFLTIHFLETVVVMVMILTRKCKRRTVVSTYYS
jgi:hypothetical protein